MFPTPEILASSQPAALGMPESRRRAIIALSRALVDGRVIIDPGADRRQLERELLALPGIGPWTAAYIAFRALGDPDVWMASDLGVRKALELAGQPSDPAVSTRLAERWRPWRSYAQLYLWASLDGATLPGAAAGRPFSHPLERTA
jgi:AraC family transcriptional regulator of adaptative response / DNA-3-methyladenine glycosylase II